MKFYSEVFTENTLITPKFFFTCEMQYNEEITVTHIQSCDNLADMFIKALPVSSFEKYRRGVGMRRLREVCTLGGELT